MSDTPDKTGREVEGLLRAWGAEEAAERAEVPPAPRVERFARRPPRVWLWPATAAAALVVVAAVGGLLHYLPGNAGYERHDTVTESAPEATGLAPDERRGRPAGSEALWASRQRMARREELAARARALRDELRGPAARRLLDRLEVLLVRLELIDAGDPGDRAALEELVAETGVAGEVERVLAAGEAPAEVREWLRRSRSVLAGEA
jgi:hypothetical protein